MLFTGLLTKQEIALTPATDKYITVASWASDIGFTRSETVAYLELDDSTSQLHTVTADGHQELVHGGEKT